MLCLQSCHTQAFYRLFKSQGPAQTLTLSLPSHLPQPLGCQLSQLLPSSDPNQLITLLSGTAPFPRDKCACKFSSPRALHTPASSPHGHSQRGPCERKTIWQNPTLFPSPQEAYLFSVSLDQLPTFGRI